MVDHSVKVEIRANDKASPALSKTRAGLESISRQLAVARNAWLALQGAMGVSGGFKALARVSDQLKLVDARLKIATGSVRAFAEAQALAYRVSTQTGAGYEAVATLYARLAQAAAGVGLTQQQVADTTELTAKALMVSGASAAETAAVVRQFSQALGSGVLRGDEFNSIMENGGRLAKALADGLGVPIGRLRQMAEQGQLTTDVIVRALASQRAAIEAEAQAMPQTIERSISALGDAFGKLVRRMDEASGASAALAKAIALLADNLDTLLGGAAAAALGMLTASLLRAGRAAAALGGIWATLKAGLRRFSPAAIAIGIFELGTGFANLVQRLRETDRAIGEMTRQNQRIKDMIAALDELTSTGTLSVKTQMMLAAQAAERLKAELPGTAEALRAIQGAAQQAGGALRQAFDAEAKKAGETVKQLSASYKQVADDIKVIWDARVAEIESHYKRQATAAQNAARSESAAIRESAQALAAVEREKLAAVEAGARQMESAWRASYGQAVALARAAGQDVAAIERQAVEARIAIYARLESAYRATVDRLIAEEQRHLQAARAADEARLNLRLSIEDRIRELARKGMDEQAAYQDRLRQIDEKQAQARAALAAGNFEQARKLAEESIALAERSASAVTRQVEQNGKTVTQTVVSEAQAAATAITQIKESAGIADAALKGLGDAHRQAASAAGQGADEARRALASISAEVERLRADLLKTDKLALEIDIASAQSGIEKLKALTEAQSIVTRIEADTQAAEAALERLKADAGNLQLLVKAEADTTQVMDDIDRLKGLLADARVEIPALASFDQPRQQLAAFAQDAKAVLSVPTEATHTPRPDLAPYRAALAELLRPTSSTHTIYVRKVSANAQGGLIQKLADGGQAVAEGFRRMVGYISGPGTETSDSIPALLSNGEFVIRAASVRRFGAAFFEALNAGFLPPLPRLATGGLVTALAASPGGAGSPGREVVDLRFHIGGKSHTVQSSRETAMQLAQALRELSRGA